MQPASDLLLPELCATRRRVELIGGKAELCVGLLRRAIVCQHFERDFAAVILPTNILDVREHKLANTLPSPFTAHNKIVDINDGFAFERGKAVKAIRQSHHLLVAIAQHAKGVPELRQLGHESGL